MKIQWIFMKIQTTSEGAGLGKFAYMDFHENPRTPWIFMKIHLAPLVDFHENQFVRKARAPPSRSKDNDARG